MRERACVRACGGMAADFVKGSVGNDARGSSQLLSSPVPLVN